MSDEIRIVMVIDTLSKMVGGGQRVLSILAEGFLARKISVSIISFAESGPPFFSLPDAVSREVVLSRFVPDESRPLSLWNAVPKLFSTFFLWRSLRKSLRKFSKSKNVFVIGFGTQTSSICAAAAVGLNLHVIASEHMHPLSTGRLGRIIRNFMFKYTNAITVLTNDAVPYFPEYLRVKMKVIPNPVLPKQKTPPEVVYDKLKPFVLAVGRLTEQKCFDHLVNAFAKIAVSTMPWNLVIVGEGPKRTELEALIEKSNLGVRVKLLGSIRNMESLYAAAEVFVLSSQMEGFPMALCEAMARGLPVVATDCPGGISTIVRDNVDGVVVPLFDVDKLAYAMNRLIDAPDLRKAMGRRAMEVVSRFSEEEVVELWIKLFSLLGASTFSDKKVGKL